MENTELDLLTIDSVDDFAAGSTKSSFSLEEGSYDNARVVGWTIVKTEFEGKERKLIKLLWQIKDGDKIHNLRGSGWTLSSNEKSTFRIEVTKWFNKTNWEDIVDLLVKGKILVKNEDGKSAHFDIDQFIGKYGKLLIAEKTSKKGSKYNVISSISPAKKKEEFAWGEVPEFLISGNEVLAYKLAEGVKIRVPEAKTETAAKPTAEAAEPQPQPKVTQVDAKEFLAPSDKDDDLPF